MRALGLVTLLVFVAHLLVQTCIVVDFLVDQDRIARELCVQRLVPDEMRTCHGHCYLSKKLKEVDERERDLPGALRALKLDDAIPQQTTLSMFRQHDADRTIWARMRGTELSGHVLVSEPVPWC